VTESQYFGLNDRATRFLSCEIRFGQKDLTDREQSFGRLVPGARHVSLEEILRNLDVNPGAVTGLAVGPDGTTMPNGF